MFGNFMNALRPVREILDIIIGKFLGPLAESEIDIEKLEKEIKDNCYGEILDLKLKSEELNRTFLKFLPIELSYGKIDKISIKFPMNYFKDKIEIQIEGIYLIFNARTLDKIDAKDFLINKMIKAAAPVIAAPFMKIINNLINNVDVSLKNISVHFLPLNSKLNTNQNTLTTPSNSPKLKLLISSLIYKKCKENPKDTLFLFNKQISMNNFLIKIEEEYSSRKEEDSFSEDENFFKLCEEKKENELINYYTEKDCILVTSTGQNSTSSKYTSLDIKFERDESNKENLIISTSLDKVELILTRNQLNVLLQISYFMKELYQKLTKIVENINSHLNQSEKISIPLYTNGEPIDILSHKLSNITFNIEITNINVVVLENLTTKTIQKPKMWLMYDYYYKKYYLSSDEINKENFNTNLIENIQRHFCYLEDNFFVFNISKVISKFNLNLKQNEKKFTLLINEINNRYVEPNSMPIKKDLIVINNIINNEVEKYFDEKFSKLFINSIKYGHFSFNIFSISNVEFEGKSNVRIVAAENTNKQLYYQYFAKINLNNINFDFNHMIVMKAYYLLMINLEEYIPILEKEAEVINLNIPIFDEKARRGSVREKILDIENKIKEIKDEKQSGSLYNKKNPNLNNSSGQINFSNSDKKITNTSFSSTNSINALKENIFTEVRIILNFKLNIKLTIHNHSNQLFKDFYNFNIHNIFEGKHKNVTIFTGNSKNTPSSNYNLNRHLLKIGDNLSREHLLLRLSSCEMMLHKHSNTENFNVYFDISKFFCFYFLNNLYFPVIQYKNNSFSSLYKDENLESDFSKYETIKQWIFVINYKRFSSNQNFEESFSDDVLYYLNSHHIKKNENFIMDEINRKKVMSQYNNNKFVGNDSIVHCEKEHQFTFQIFLNKIDFLVNYTYLNNLIDFFKITNYSLKYFTMFSEALNWKFYSNLPRNSKEASQNFHYTINLQLNEINMIGFSNLNLSLCENYNLNVNNLNNLNNLNDPSSSFENTGNINNYINFEIISDYLLLEKYLNLDENIFNIIDHPFFKIQLTNFYLTYLNTNKNYIMFSLDNFKVLIRKNDNIYHDIKIKYQIFFQGVYEEENFEHFMYKGNSNVNYKRNLVSTLAKFESKLRNKSKSVYDLIDPSDMNDFISKVLIYQNNNICHDISVLCLIDDIVISPLFNNLDESITLFEEIKKDFYRMKILLKNESTHLWGINRSNNFKSEILQNEKVFSLNSNNQNINAGNDNTSNNSEHSENMSSTPKIDLNLNIQISRIILDLFSHSSKRSHSHTHHANTASNTNKMRLITEIEGIIFEENKQDSLNANFNAISQLGANYFPRSINLSITRINSIFLKNLDYKNSQSILINKCHNISKENSYWRKKGFVEIFNLDHMQISLFEQNNNFKSEFIINSIEFSFCKDSFKHFVKFLSKSKVDFNYLINLVYKPNDFDKESVITEFEMIQDKMVNEQIRFPLKGNTGIINANTNMDGNLQDTSIEYKKVNTSYKGRKIVGQEKERAQSAENRKENSGLNMRNFNKTNNFNIKPMAESWKETKFDSLYILDGNYDRRSNSSHVGTNRKGKEHSNNFHSENSPPSSMKDDVKMEDKEIENVNINVYNPVQYSNEKEIANKIVEKLNLFFALHSFKVYLFDEKDFQFIDSYNNVQSGDTNNATDLDASFSNNNLFTGVKKNDLEFNITMITNLRNVKIIEDYLNINTTNTENETITSSKRMRSVQRDYSNYILVNADNIETKFIYYSNSPLVVSHVLEVRSFTIIDSIKESKFKKLLSNYNFEDDTRMFLTLNIDILRPLKNEIEICLFLQLTPLNILVDQLTLKFLIRFFKIRVDSLTNDLSPSEDKTTTEKQINNENQSKNESVTISQINADHININSNSLTDEKATPFPFAKLMGEDARKVKFFAKRFIIQEFSVNICYNAQKIHLEALKDKQLLEYLNISSINDLMLHLKNFEFKEKKNLNDLISELFEYWKKDILQEQFINAYLSSMSLIRPFKNIVGSFMEMVTQPYSCYVENRSVQEGIANGVKNFVVSFSTEALTLGEKFYNFLKGIFGTRNKKRKCLYRKLVYTINEDRKKYDDYILK